MCASTGWSAQQEEVKDSLRWWACDTNSIRKKSKWVGLQAQLPSGVCVGPCFEAVGLLWGRGMDLTAGLQSPPASSAEPMSVMVLKGS